MSASAKAVVADTSVLGVLIFQEPDAPKAASLLEGAQLYEPPLLAYELASIALKKIHKYPSQKNNILAAFNMAIDMDIHWVETDHAAVIDVAMEKNLTVYDATYLYLARACKIPLITFDQRLKSAN